MGSCSAKSWPVEGFPREKDSCMFLLSQCVCPGKTPPWLPPAQSSTCLSREWSRGWRRCLLPGLQVGWQSLGSMLALHLPLRVFFLVHPWLSVILQGGRWQCCAGDALWRTPLVWRKIIVRSGLSAKSSTGGQRPEQEDANLMSGLGNHPEWATGTLAAPMSQDAGTLPTCA